MSKRDPPAWCRRTSRTAWWIPTAVSAPAAAIFAARLTIHLPLESARSGMGPPPPGEGGGGVGGAPAGGVAREPGGEVIRRAGVERPVAAAEEVDGPAAVQPLPGDAASDPRGRAELPHPRRGAGG